MPIDDMPISLNAQTKLLFIGDSITDCGRKEDEAAIGTGYVRTVRDYLCAKSPADAPRVINRGVSGNKVPDLEKRWRRDVLDHAPDVLSIFIGINDVWHGLLPDRAGCDVDRYRSGYRGLLAQTREVLPTCTLVLCEPSVLWLPEMPWANERLAPYIVAVQDLAREF